jgi:hypothetical protein
VNPSPLFPMLSPLEHTKLLAPVCYQFSIDAMAL